MEQATIQNAVVPATGIETEVKAKRRTREGKNPGFWLALPSMIVLLLCFIVPLVLVLIYSFQEPYEFLLSKRLSLLNYKDFIGEKYYSTLGWSVVLAILTTVFTFIFSYPCAYAMVKVFTKKSIWITLLLVMPIFVTTNIRLFGWTLILLKGGFLHFLTNWIPGMGHTEFLYNFPVIVMGTTYIYFPFMLFPLVLGLGMVDDEAVEAAIDLGANRWQVFKEVEFPMAAAGIFIGCLLVFVLSLGSMVEAQVLGGNAITTFADDMHHAFSFQQNWPLGSALSVILLGLTLTLIIVVLRYVNLDKLLSSRAKLG
ncbi:MAG: ABC transporter permease subunit [Proteobacteria bacterium]|nr:ABC transporter permease subunit [Pseudomonadota bacterium]